MKRKYKYCEECNNIIESTNDQKTCCNKIMVEKEINSNEGTIEKHKPVINIKDNKAIINIGEISHPMEENHYIKWIKIITNKRELNHKFSSNDIPSYEITLNEGETIL